MIRAVDVAQDYDVVPQAIFWRPIRYFATKIRTGEDGLDIFEAASFAIGNMISFDLRKYRGHPEFTTTLYLPFGVEDPGEIAHTLRQVIQGLAMPTQAVAWRRGQPFGDRELSRPAGDRLREPEARTLALKIAAQSLGRTASTELIKQQTPHYITLSKKDIEPSNSRLNESRWQQIVGNVISHRRTATGPFKLGYAVRTEDGLRVTDDGLVYLNNMGFSV